MVFAPCKKGNDKPRQQLKKQRYHFTDKGGFSQSYGFSSSHVSMWELSWVMKNWWTVVLEKTLESPLNSRKSNQSIPKEINPEYSLEGLILKLKLQYFSHLMWTVDSLENTLVLWLIEGRRKRGQQKMKWLDSIPKSMDMSLNKLGRQWRTGKPGVLQSMGSQRDMTAWQSSNNSISSNIWGTARLFSKVTVSLPLHAATDGAFWFLYIHTKIK